MYFNFFVPVPVISLKLQVDENEMRELFGRYGSVREVKIITYRGGICKG